MTHSDEYETLSALIDGELSDDQVRFMLRRMDGHAGLRASWSRYHLIADGVRGDLPPLADDDFVARVMQHVDVQMPVTAADESRPRRHVHRWLRWSAGGAIAAGVAVAALVVTQPQMNDTPATLGVGHATTASTLASAGAEHPASGDAGADEVMGAPAVPRWLQASPSAARLASPAAANVSSLGQWMRMNEGTGGYYERNLAPYMQLPQARRMRRAEQGSDVYRLWRAPRAEAPAGSSRLQIQ